jgi:SOS-response transcriptional repressor LexA
MKTNVLRKTENTWKPTVMSAEEAMEWLDGKGISYELCDVAVPVTGNCVNCGKPFDAGEQTIDGCYYLPKSVVGLHPLLEIPAQGNSMTGGDIKEGDLLQTEIGATPSDGDTVIADVNREHTAKVIFTDNKNRHWLIPRNQDYDAIELTDDMEVRITGVVRNIVKKSVRCSYSECMAAVNRTLAKRQQQGDVFQRLAKAVSEGNLLFWASSSWAVVYCVARDCSGYEGTVSEFERKAENMNLPMRFDYPCSEGKVQRTISNHPYMRLHIDKWKENGASVREIVLMEFLRKNL